MDAKRIRHLLAYDPITGFLMWRHTRGPVIAGQRAGCIHKLNGYRYLTIDGRTYREHRIVWLHVTGEWPLLQIDHKNLDRADNRWVNLRMATDSQNKANTQKTRANKSGLKGVSPSRGKWAAFISVNGKVKNLGRYKTKEEAYVAYCAASTSTFGEFSRL